MMGIPLVFFILRISDVIEMKFSYLEVMTQHLTSFMINAMSFCTSLGLFSQSFKTPFMAYAKSDTSFQLNITLKRHVTFALIFCGVVVSGVGLGSWLATMIVFSPYFIKPCLATGDYSYCLTFADSVIGTFIILPTLLTTVYHLASCVLIAKGFEKYFDSEITPIIAAIEDCRENHLER